MAIGEEERRVAVAVAVAVVEEEDGEGAGIAEVGSPPSCEGVSSTGGRGTPLVDAGDPDSVWYLGEPLI